MKGALGLLIVLQLRGWLRYLLRSLRTLKGALLALVGVMVFVPWMAAVLLGQQREGGWLGNDPRQTGPIFLLIYCIFNVVFSTGERSIYFPPAEVNFLFSGPFGRRQLLAYKIASTLLISVPTALFMSLVFRFPSSSWAASLTAMLLIIMFMQLFSMALNLLAVSVGARLYSRGRRFAVLIAVLVGAVLLWHNGDSMGHTDPQQLFKSLKESQIWQIVSWPLRWFFAALTAERLYPDLLVSAALSALVDLVLVGVVFALDAQFLEASATASARIYARKQRLRRGGMGAGEGLRRSGKARLRLPMLPWLGGAGPTTWRQLTTALRGADRLLLLLLILSASLAAPMLAALRDEDEGVLFALAPVAVWMTLFLTTLLPFDFRGDVDRLAFLKSLPLAPWRLAIGQLLAPVLMMTTLQWLGLAGVVCFAPANKWLLLTCLICAAYVVPINFFLFALDNLLFLLFPTRLMASSPGDFQALGRNVLFMVAKLTALALVAFAAMVVGAIVYFLTEGNWLLIALAAWPVVAVSAAALVPFVAWAFIIFDVGRDTPA